MRDAAPTHMSFTTDEGGYPLFAVDLIRFHTYFNRALEVPVLYHLGAKCPGDKLGEISPFPFSVVDCSGWVQAHLFYATRGAVQISDGNWNEESYFVAKKFKRGVAPDCGKQDAVLRVCVHRPDHLETVGHTWLVLDGETYESYSARGVHSRDWNHPSLKTLAHDVFEVAHL
jgi:hypothetical protein